MPCMSDDEETYNTVLRHTVYIALTAALIMKLISFTISSGWSKNEIFRSGLGLH